MSALSVVTVAVAEGAVSSTIKVCGVAEVAPGAVAVTV